MAWLFVQLKLRLMAGALRGTGSRARLAGLVLAVAGGLYVMPAGFILLASMHGRPLAGDVGIVVFTTAFTGWAVLPLLAFGSDETLDPARLALLPLRRRPLAAGLLAAALTGIGPVVTFVVLLGVVAAVATGPGSALVGLAGVALELVLCVAASRALVTAFSGLLRTRRGSDLGMIAGALLTFGVIAANLAFQRSVVGGRLGQGVRAAAGLARWAPPGMVAHAISAAARGDYPAALAGLAVGAATALALLWAWIAVLGRALTSQDASTQGGRGRRRAAVPAVPALLAVSAVPAVPVVPAHPAVPALPALPVAAAAPAAALASRWRAVLGNSRALTVTAKELRYSWRDPRRKAAWLGLATAVIVAVSVSGLGTGRGLAGAVGPVLVLAAVYGGAVAGLQSANQFGLDGGALWLNVAATWRPQQLRADLAGKNLASALVALPVFALLYTALGLLAGQATYPAAAFGMAAAALGVTLGIASMASVLMPYAVPQRRASAFGGAGTGRGFLAGLANLAIIVLAVISLGPVLVLLALVHTGLWLLPVGPAYGAALAWLGRMVASDIGFRRLPELLAEVSRPV